MKPPVEPPQRPPPEPPQNELEERPRGLLGLILWPLQFAISAGLRLFAALVSGVLSALLGKTPPAEKKEPREPSE